MKTPTQYLLTCQSGLESLVKRECEKLSLKEIQAQDRLVKCSGNSEDIYKLLIWSRFANRVYISLAEKKITDFDSLFELCESIEWSRYLSGEENIIIEAASTRFLLSSVPKIQSIGQKAIFSMLRTPNTTNGVEVHVLLLLIDDTLSILLDVTGDPLHKRGYRKESGEAPIKENLAAALVAFANWKYKTPLYDPFCGSGTILIEAAMMARNIAPGLSRHFKIESLLFFERESLERAKKEAREKIYPSGNYTLMGKDRDISMIQIAESNAKKAGVSEDIRFESGDYMSELYEDKYLISNPPYGKRLEEKNIEEIHSKLQKEVSASGGGFITSHPVKTKTLANKKLLNGNEECRFWYKKG